MDFKKYFAQLNRIEKVFFNKETIDIKEVSKFIYRTLGMNVDLNILKAYLKEKGYKNIIDKTDDEIIEEESVDETIELAGESDLDPIEDSVIMLEYDYDMDADIDDILQMDLPVQNHDEYEPRDQFQSNLSQDFKYKDNIELIRKFQTTKDSQLMDIIITLNRKMVLKEANYYGRYLSGHGVSEDDLVQEGILGLIKAVKRFDYNRGNEFSTYALHWIRQYIMRYIQNHENVVRLPVHRLEQIKKLKECEKKLFSVNGNVDIKEVCERLDIPEKLYHELKIYDHCFVCIDSLDKNIGEDDTAMIDLIPDKTAENPVIEEVLSKQLHEQIFALLSKLKKRESEVLKLRYGLDTGDTMTLEEVGKSFNVTRERIRQIESIAIKKLEVYGRSVCLADFR